MDDDIVGAPAITISDGVLRPRRRHARSNRQLVAALVEAENCLEADAIHPACRSRVPRPAAAPEMTRGGVDIGRDDERLDFVRSDILRRARVGEGVEHLK